ncbi:MAG: 50S ribosomal protein L14 [Microgenomates group bacterium GW2011_GWA1_Microgenomates_45_10]|nr:MAG: 50S ribosomal protein L14 [Microgenomates group bacterium GW2011_GWA2_44_7]KKT78078.1 MAG: 50S ribosomal protein L14 [Microgenomates group bacterium GW2011_GWB1_44_8]KKT87415.1 MAG: 50S ribosomal protein L14 [Microgenomates group bacterium GW2011_GWA1_Microgenomates_45_10]
MIQLRSILVAADNTGARGLRMIHVYGGSRRTYASLGDTIGAVVTAADPNGTVKDSEMVKAVVVRVRQNRRRVDGSYIRFDDNAAVIIDAEGNPRGSRIFGPVAREVKEKGFNKIVSLAQEVL